MVVDAHQVERERANRTGGVTADDDLVEGTLEFGLTTWSGVPSVVTTACTSAAPSHP